jgi:hypothetical protein
MALFTPPDASASVCQNVPFMSASDTAIDNKAEFDAFDQTPEGINDPSRCKALLAFPDGTIFWSSKMAIDGDGPAAGPGRLCGSELDPDSGQNDTSFHFCDTDQGLPSEAVPFIVLPGGTFRTNTGLELGDVALVIYKDKIAAAICGDIGPSRKIGEGAIRLHEALHPPAPDPCSERQPDGSCKRILNDSIDEDVLFFVFPKSGFGQELMLSNLETLINERAFALYNKFRGAT